jgi:hypothetical protein
VSYPNITSSPLGRILNLHHHPDGTSDVVLDNGADKTITIVTLSERLPDLLAEDMPKLRAHLMSRHSDHFIRK